MAENKIAITAYNADNEKEEYPFTVFRLENLANSASDFSSVSDVDDFVKRLPERAADSKLWAVLIGIQNYRRAARVEFADRDVLFMGEYMSKVQGVSRDQTFSLLNGDATKSDIWVLFEDRLQSRAQKGDTVFIYFAGHGIPDAGSGTPYLLPAEGDPESLSISAYALRDLYAAVGKLQANHVVVFLDACFSGLSARQQELKAIVPGTRYLVIAMETPLLFVQYD